MKLRATLAAVLFAAAITIAGCGGEAGPSPEPTGTPAPTSTATPAATATPAPTPTPPPSPIWDWATRYRGPAGGADWALAMALDGAGNAYVTGKSFSEQPYDYSYNTVKYDGTGDPLWMARYDGPGGDDDVAHAIAVDASGNVYVTGKSYTALHSDYAYATVKYDGNGTELWAGRYDAPGEVDDVARAIAVDGSGNVYVTGGSGGDYATVKYDSGGDELWVARYDGPSGGDDEAVAIGVDADGNAYVTGTSEGHLATLKYSRDGDQVWLARHEGAARALAVDGSGNVYVAGQSGDQYATIRYDSDGNEVWIAGCHGRACGKGEAAAISLDEAGNVYVTGSIFGGPGARYGYVTVKYGSDGLQRWVIRYDAPGGGEIEAADIEVDASGNVFVTGSVVNIDWDFLTVAYDGGGNLLWVGSYDGPSGRRDKAAAVAVDPSGNVYVTGRSDGGATCSDYALVKYLPGD